MSSMIKMPLKLRLGKKSGRYDLSQDIYVLSIFVGDVLLVQCTLTSDSTAQQCMEYLMEKIDLTQVKFFALRYHMKCNDPDRRMMRWVEMDKSLRKQLEKWACKPRQVQLAILFHTPNVFALSDPTARSLYYNLLKLDVIHGKFVMDVDKYINLAAYSMQVEYGDYNADLHTMEFLRSLPLLPQNFFRNSQLVDEFLVRILTVYERLNGMQPSYAAFLYIVDAQQCEGYGEEFFTAKDDESTEVQVGYSPDGLIVKRCHSNNLKYRWQDIKDICNAKRTLHVKCKMDATNAQFTMEDQEVARYVVQVLTWQWQYALTDAIQHKAVPMSINNLQGAIRTFGSQPTPRINGSELLPSSNHSLDLTVSQTSSYCPSQPSSSSSINRFAPFIGRNQNSGLHPVQSFQHHVNSGVMNVNRNRAATSASIQHLPTLVSTPSLTHQNSQYPGQYNKQSNVYRPSSSRAEKENMNTPQFDSRLAERHILKEMVNQQQIQQKTMGSSPEIHMMGTNNLRNYGNSHLMRRAQSNARGFQSNNQRVNNFSDEKFVAPGHALSTPDLALKWMSSPDLISSAVANQLAAIRQQQSISRPPIVSMVSEPPHASSTSSSSSGGRVRGTPGAPRFSLGHVISGTRPPGQPITYPVPVVDQSGTTMEPPTYIQAVGRKPVQSPHMFYNPNSLPQSSIASSSSADSYVRQLNSEESEGSEPDASVNMDRSFRSPSPPASETKQMRHVLLNGVARTGSLATQNLNTPDNSNSNDETLRSLRDKLETPQGIDAEFAAVPWKRLSAGVSTSQHPENQPRNRPGNVFPYEDTRVMLTPSKHNTDGYINASNVHLPIGDYIARYIVCQAPMKSTTDDFWQMIWESGARLIVMLVNPNQVAKTDSIPPYWPTKTKEKMALNDYFVKMVSSTTTTFQTTSVLSLKCLRTGERRTIYHLYCADFAVDGVPSSESSFLAFIDAVSSLKRQIENERAVESDTGIFSVLQGNRRTSRTNLTDMTNRKRSQSAEGGGWRRKLRLATSSTHTPPSSKRASHNSSTISDTSVISDASQPSDQNLEPPTVVHCTDGASESGVYLLVESLIQCTEHNLTVDVPNTLKALRQQRMYLVKNVNQYRFAYSILTNFLEQSRLI